MSAVELPRALRAEPDDERRGHPTAKSIVDYIFRWMGKKFLSTDRQEEIGILSPEVRARLAQSYAALEGQDCGRCGRGAGRSPAGGPDGAVQRVRGRPGVRSLWCANGADTQLLHVPRLWD
jgi:hypothetical protein